MSTLAIMMFTTLSSTVGLGVYSLYRTRQDIKNGVKSRIGESEAWFNRATADPRSDPRVADDHFLVPLTSLLLDHADV